MHFLYYFYRTEMRYQCFIKILRRVDNSILESDDVRLKGALSSHNMFRSCLRISSDGLDKLMINKLTYLSNDTN